MRDHVTFRCRQEFVPVSEEDGVLAVDGAKWFLKILAQVQDLIVDSEMCQEDWGVAFFARRNARHFWIGLNWWADSEWLAHVHHWGWLQRFSRSGKDAFFLLLGDLERALTASPSVSNVEWHAAHDL